MNCSIDRAQETQARQKTLNQNGEFIPVQK
jgi:hypothetical protein